MSQQAASNESLMVDAATAVARADDALKRAVTIGLTRPVDAQLFTVTLYDLRLATAAVTELERRARGGEMPKGGN